MGFASGFQAGLSAVRTAKEMRDERMLRDELANLENEYTQTQQPYEQAEETAGLTGAPLQSAAPVQAGMQSPANVALGLGGPAPAMSPVAQQPTMAAQALGAKPEPIPVSAPSPMSDRDYRMKQIGLYRKFGDPRLALEMERSMAAEEQANRQYDLAVKKFDALNDQFTKTFGEQVRSARVSEEQAQDKIDVLIDNQDRLAKETAATIKNMATRLNAFTEDRDTAQAVTSGKELFKQGLRQGKNVDEILTEIEAKYPGEENNAMRMAAVTAATDEYYTQNGINDVIAGKIVQRATSPITAALNTDFDGDIAKEATNWNEVLQSFADPDYSDGIETRLVQIRDPETGEPTGAFELAYGDRTLEQFNSIEDVRNYAKQYQEGFTKNPFQIGQYIENTKAKAAADIARAKSTSEKNELFAGFLEANPHLMGDEEKLMQLRMQLGISSPLGGWSGNYVNTQGSGGGGLSDILPSTTSKRAAAEEASRTEATKLTEGEIKYARLMEDLTVLDSPDVELSDLENVMNDRYAPAEVRERARQNYASRYYNTRRQRGLSPYIGM